VKTARSRRPNRRDLVRLDLRELRARRQPALLTRFYAQPRVECGGTVRWMAVDVGSDLRKLSSGKPLTSYIAQAELCKSRLNSASYLLTGQFNM
jgi:hypothetical protein